MILHFDLDAFYAAVAQRDDPSLRGKPVAVAGHSRRAVVLTASYEARPFGIHSAQPLYLARAACPDLIVVPPDFEKYQAASQAVFAILAQGAVAFEGLSLDEAFVEIACADTAAATAWAADVRTRVRTEVGLTMSAGVAAGKMVAKIACDSGKPDGLCVVEPHTEAAFLAPLPVGRLFGIGPITQARLEAAGIFTVGEVAALDDRRAFSLLGRFGDKVRALAAGIDANRVDGSRERKSISTEQTFEYDVRDEAEVIAHLRVAAEELAQALQSRALRAGTVGVKVKRSDFAVVGRQRSVTVPIDAANQIYLGALRCWERTELRGQPIRLLGIRVSALTRATSRELSLF